MKPDIDRPLRIVRRGQTCLVTIDGDEFPLYLAEEPIEITVDPNDVSHVRFTVLSADVEIVDKLDDRPRLTPQEVDERLLAQRDQEAARC